MMLTFGHRSPDGLDDQVQEGNIIMFARIETAQRVALSLVGALFFSAVLFSAAVPVVPVA
ncbi:hypothetical protein [Sphingomonas sp. RT2P30]|uniref:hypothetical protein n=1 Tax=Parasphingomonas halimpatiens TaxID=3096162 RepID=UPI002FCAFB06